MSLELDSHSVSSYFEYEFDLYTVSKLEFLSQTVPNVDIVSHTVPSHLRLVLKHDCLQEEDLDCPQGMIDFSLYLRSSNQAAQTPSDADIDDTEPDDNMTVVLDQKNYIEELNCHLK